MPYERKVIKLERDLVVGHPSTPTSGANSTNRWVAGYPFEVLSWSRSACRYLMGNFNAGWPFERDYLTARRTLVPLIKLWAYDHLCLFARLLPLPSEPRSHR